MVAILATIKGERKRKRNIRKTCIPFCFFPIVSSSFFLVISFFSSFLLPSHCVSGRRRMLLGYGFPLCSCATRLAVLFKPVMCVSYQLVRIRY